MADSYTSLLIPVKIPGKDKVISKDAKKAMA
jgi:hypothetical protein